MITHALPTVLIAFNAEWLAKVDNKIKQWSPPNAGAITSKLDGTGIIHFASISTVKVSDQDAYIVIEMTSDCACDDALRAFARCMTAELTELLLAAAVPWTKPMESWLAARRVRIGSSLFTACGLLFDGSPEMSVGRIKAEAQLVETIEETARSLRLQNSPAQLLAALRQEVSQWPGAQKAPFVPQPAPILDPPPPAAILLNRLRIYAHVGLRFLVWPLPLFPALFLVLALLPQPGGWLGRLGWPLVETAILLALAAGVLTAVIRWHEEHDAVSGSSQSRQAAEDILREENFDSQNILSTVSVLKPGWARRVTLRLVFLAIETMLPLYWSPGRLGNLNDIHFMRWLLLPGTDLLVFRSHYDGSWVNYIEDFALRAPQGVSAIWSNTQGFPRTRWLTTGGAAAGPAFRRWVHTQTTPVFFRYSAYPSLSMERIRLNARIVRALATGVMDPSVQGWLTSLGDANGGDF